MVITTYFSNKFFYNKLTITNQRSENAWQKQKKKNKKNKNHKKKKNKQKKTDFIVGKEPDWHAKRFGFEYIICNAFMASTPDNDFINFVCQRFINHSGGKDVNNGIDILDSTGPFLLTHAFNAFPHKEDIRILESKTIYPIGQWEVEKIKNTQIPNEMEERINQAHAIHYFFGTWFGK